MKFDNKKKPIKNNLREHKINNEIRSKVVFLINADGAKIGNISIYEAINQALNQSLDLVQIAQNDNIPVCKIMDYGRFCFEQKKNKAKKDSKLNDIKEMQFNPAIDEHDFQVKLKKIIEFLANHKVNVILKFKGRQAMHPQIGMQIFEKIIEQTKEISKIESPPKIEGKRGSLLLSPKKS